MTELKEAIANGRWTNEIPIDKELRVQTRNTLYEIRINPTHSREYRVMIRGSARYCPTWTPGNVIAAGSIGMLFTLKDHLSMIQTSDIVHMSEITLADANNSASQASHSTKQ